MLKIDEALALSGAAHDAYLQYTNSNTDADKIAHGLDFKYGKNTCTFRVSQGRLRVYLGTIENTRDEAIGLAKDLLRRLTTIDIGDEGAVLASLMEEPKK